MRNGGYMMQQTLTPEASTILKQAITLAKRRGHPQVTPLHVAQTMLSSTTGLFRRACLKSHSHPLQCKALDLCFNVALSRLPASSSNPMFGSHITSHPLISNALKAAVKRAQAHQRRGCIESQQQPLLAVKIELEQLIVSILDDPSVSRVMREARFSSTQVKINVEKAVSLELSSQNTNIQNKNPKENYQSVISQPSSNCQGLCTFEGESKGSNQTRDEYIGLGIDNMLQNGRKNIVLVGECVDTLEGFVRDLIEKVNTSDVPESLSEVKFIKLPILSLNISREEVEQKLVELRSIVKTYLEKGVVLYLGDLKWVSEYRASSSCDQGRGMRKYSHVDYLVTEIGKLECGLGENDRFWLLGVACSETYMKCKSGNPSLESILWLHPIPTTNVSLNLSLNHESYTDTGISRSRSSISTSQLATRSLPLWLQKYKAENNSEQGCIQRSDLSEGMRFTLSPSISSNSFSDDRQSSDYDPRSSLCGNSSDKGLVHASSPFPSLGPNSTSSSCFMEVEYVPNFNELNYENFKTLCTSLEQQVASQWEIIPEIVTTILQCRSRRKSVNGEIRSNNIKEVTWMCFQGIDMEDKEKIARELAQLIFDSSSNFVSVTLSSCSCSKANSKGTLLRNKRLRDGHSDSYLERFSEALFCNPHRVFFLEDIEHVDYYSQLGIKTAIKSGSVRDSQGKEICLQDSIIVLSYKNIDLTSRTSSPHSKQMLDNDEIEKVVPLDLNVSLEDTKSSDDYSFLEIGLLECVDKWILLKTHTM